MKIYDLNSAELRKEMNSFSKTEFGRIIFFEAFCAPILLFFVCLINIFLGTKFGMTRLLLLTPICTFIDIIMFLLGHIYYMHELKEFVNSNK